MTEIFSRECDGDLLFSDHHDRAIGRNGWRLGYTAPDWAQRLDRHDLVLGGGSRRRPATIVANGSLERRAIVLLLITLWSLRLAGHIGTRTHGSKEDPRYGKLIGEWGDRAALRLFMFLQAQAVAAFVLVLTVYLAASNDEYLLGPLDFLAFAVGFIALGGEAVSDAQLARFRKSLGAETRVCELGLWRYSRHPNYFFEWLFWCCFPLFALGGPLWSWLSMMAPMMMYWLLVHVSGIPPLEDYMLALSRFKLS